MRKSLSTFLFLVPILVVSGLGYEHFFRGLAIRTAFRSGQVTRFVRRTGARLKAVIGSEKIPSAPEDLSGGPTPVIQLVQKFLNVDHVTRHSTAPFDSSGGDLIIACASSHYGTILTLSDNFHNTWISAAGPTTAHSAVDLRSQIWYAKAPKVGPGHILRMSLSTPQSLVISIFVIRGASVSDPIDAVSPIGDDGGTDYVSLSSPTIETTSANDLLIGFGKLWMTDAWTAADGFVMQPEASSAFLFAESGLAIKPGKYRSEFDIDIPTAWQAAVVAVRPSASRERPSEVSLAWSSPEAENGPVGYRIERCPGAACEDFSEIGTSRENSFTDFDVPSPDVYRYRVRAFDAASNFSDYSNTISVSPKGAEKSVAGIR